MFDEYISDIIYFVNIQIYMKIHGTILVESHDDRLDGIRVASWSPLTSRVDARRHGAGKKAKKRWDRAWPFSLKTLRGTRRKRAFFCCHRQRELAALWLTPFPGRCWRGGSRGRQTGNTCRYKLPRCVTSNVEGCRACLPHPCQNFTPFHLAFRIYSPIPG